MVYRKYNAPNVEYNEIDRSQYGTIGDNAAVGTMSFIAGFADKGDDYDPKYSRSLADFVNTYGYPTNEAERYFYYAAKEVFSKGGRTITSKIPYDNDSKDKFSYTVYESDGLEHLIEESESVLDSETNSSVNPFGNILSIDKTISSYFEIKSVEKDRLTSFLSNDLDSSGLMTMAQYDDLLVGRRKPAKNSFCIVNTARNEYSKDPNIIDLREYQTSRYLGYVPVVVSPMNAMYFQHLISVDSDSLSTFDTYNVVQSIQTIPNLGTISTETGIEKINQVDFGSAERNFETQIWSTDPDSETVGKMASKFFPSIKFYSEDKIDRTYLKQIGIVVFKMVSDTSNDGRIRFVPAESFIGSLDRKATDEVTGKNIFIDNIVNESSELINVFSNFDFGERKGVLYMDGKESAAITSTPIGRAATILVSNQTATTLGFFESQCSKFITTGVLESSLDTILDKIKDPYTFPLDIICDAGVSNIAQYMASLGSKTLFYEPEFDFDGDFSITDGNSTFEWKKILQKFDNLAKSTRKDCIFIADGLRSLCLTGNEKIVRKTAPTNTILKNLVPKIRFMLAPNSSYGAGYCNWFKCVDDVSQTFFWCPPSIKAMGVYLYTDRYANVWDAPAGDNRGVVAGAYDIAFNPTVAEAERFYDQQWNYAVSYPLNGIVIEGQKTFQVDRTALDRVNVRRLCLGIKKGIKEIARWFKYEGITPQVLSGFRDQITEFLQKVQLNYGISEYFVKIDDENNTPETADRNEIHAAISIRPIKSAEFIVIQSIVVNQSADLEEVTQSVLS